VLAVGSSTYRCSESMMNGCEDVSQYDPRGDLLSRIVDMISRALFPSKLSQGKLFYVTCCHPNTNRQLEEKTALIWYTRKTFFSQLGVQCALYHMYMCQSHVSTMKIH
jgi:hypothetical protein